MGVLTTGYLMVNSWTDWRRKEVDIVWTVAVFVLLASLWRSDQIGSGDGIVLMGIGWIQGIQQACVIFQTAILLAAAVGVCMLALGMGRKKELPFVPFLLAGYLVQYI